jgi:hypothetical protein
LHFLQKKFLFIVKKKLMSDTKHCKTVVCEQKQGQRNDGSFLGSKKVADGETSEGKKLRKN